MLRARARTAGYPAPNRCRRAAHVRRHELAGGLCTLPQHHAACKQQQLHQQWLARAGGQHEAHRSDDDGPSTSGRDAEALAQQGSSSSSSSSSRNNLGRLLLLGGLVVAAAAAVSAAGGVSGFKERVHDLESLIVASGYLGPLIYATAYSAAALFFFPASVLTLAAGYLFGPLKGTALASLSATAGACLAFVVARYLARPMVEGRLSANPRFKAVYNRITADGAKLVLLMRLSPLFPFAFINYSLGITRVKFLDFALASWAGMLPATAAYVYLGSVGKVAAEAAASGAPIPFDAAKAVVYAVGGIATVWATKLISEAATKAISEEPASIE